MNEPTGTKNMSGCLPPLIETKADVIERNAVSIKTFAIGSKYDNLLRREVQHLTDLEFLASDLFLGALLFAQVEDEGYALASTFNSAPPTSTGTRLPSFRKNSFSYGCAVPVAFRLAMARSSRSRHSGGVRSAQSIRRETRSSRLYCSMRRKASLAPMTHAPSTSPMKIPRILASTRRRILSSVVLRSVMSVTAPTNSRSPDA